MAKKKIKFDKVKANEMLNIFSNIDKSNVDEKKLVLLMHSYDQVKFAANIPDQVFLDLFGDGTNENGIAANYKMIEDFISANEDNETVTEE